MVESAAPVEHVFAADELFFSTTDSHGRIRRANSTFMRLSGYPRGALVGRAHNVVRHADMPAGLFRSIWDAIEAGRAASAYITNRSSDDGHYRVFATIVPSGSGYLSVRTLPMLTDLRDDVEAAYARVRDVEEASAAAGSTRREVAAAGQAAFQAELQALGYADAIDFTRRVLVAEVGELLAHGVGIPDSPQADGPVARILDAMSRIEAETAGLVGILQEGQRLVDLLGKRAGEIEALSARLGALREAMRAVGADVEVLGHGEQADDVAARCQQVDALVLECSEQLHPLSSQIEALRGDLDSVSFRIALARLHNLAAGIFAVQIIEGQDEVDANDAVGSLTELCSALSDGADNLTQRVGLLDARRELVGGELDVVAEDLGVLQGPILELIEAAAAAGAGQADSVTTARTLAGQGFAEARDLADLAVRVRDLEVPFEAEAINSALADVRTALAELE
ncbi:MULTISPECIES: PAS domain-containing protein [Actinomyces]|uniref:Chemotaxis protein n=1 Tax=Actinomyces oris TaxID=544580 RepID=A0A1Q8VKM1_9ACTO|nr:PAS domain-containing protein [Actinomyces oris]OLO48623.1 chemotaxis protein [Actinomyces oris]